MKSLVSMTMAAALVSLAAAPLHADPQTKSQQKCVATANKQAQKIHGAVAKHVCGCIGDAAKSAGPAAVEACVVGGPGVEKITSAVQKTTDAFAKSCSGEDKDGVAKIADIGVADASAISESSVDETTEMFRDLFGNDLDAGVIDGTGDTTEIKCQAALAKAVKKCASTRLKEYSGCTKSELSAGTDSRSALRDACLGIGIASQTDGKGKIAKTCDLSGAKIDKIRKTISKKCAAGDVDRLTTFIGCNTVDDEELHECASGAAACRACRIINESAALDRNCDELDNALNDGSCEACGNGITEGAEQCDGADDAACPGECSSLCSCPGPRTFAIDELTSDAVISGLGADIPVDLDGSIDLDVTGEVAPGALRFEIAVQQLPPATFDVVGAPQTLCVFFEQAPALDPGIAGEGVINCSGADLTATGFFEGIDLTEFLDHCIEGAGGTCDSAPNPGGGILHAASGVFVPDDVTDPECDDSGSSVDLVSGHEGACNTVPVETVGSMAYGLGDATFTVEAVFDLRAGTDNCMPPITPGSQGARLEFTTGPAQTGIMDRNANPGNVVAQALAGAPFDCKDFLFEDNASGAAFVGAFPVIDVDLGILIRDLVIGVSLAGE